MTVITISRQFGSGGDEIASRVCEILGYQAFDKNLINRAAQEAGLSNQEIIDYSEENHKTRGFLDRLFDRSHTVATTRFWREDATGARFVEEYKLTEDAAVTLVQRAVWGAYRAGNLVVLGRGGQVILKDQPSALHIRIEAPFENRVQRVVQQTEQAVEPHNEGTELRREAQDLIAQKDAASQDYLQRFYNVDWSDPLLYHMVLNTGKLSIEQASQLIVSLVQTSQSEPKRGDQIMPTA